MNFFKEKHVGIDYKIYLNHYSPSDQKKKTFLEFDKGGCVHGLSSYFLIINNVLPIILF